MRRLKLDNPALTDDALIDAMMAHPILINRPIVVTPDAVKLCRPSEAVLDILPKPTTRRVYERRWRRCSSMRAAFVLRRQHHDRSGNHDDAGNR